MRRRAGAVPAGKPRPVVGDHVPLRPDPPRHNGRGRAAQAYIHTCMHTYIQTYIHSNNQTTRHTYIQANIHTYIYIHFHSQWPRACGTGIYTYITCMHACMHSTYIYLHFHSQWPGACGTGACKPPRSPSSISPRPPTPWRSRCVLDALAYVMLLRV